MGTIILLAIITIAGYFIGAYWAHEIVGAIFGFVIGLGLRFGESKGLGDAFDIDGGFD